MTEFKFKLGEEVMLTPLKNANGTRALVTAHCRYLDGSIGYQVSCLEVMRGSCVVRHTVMEYEIQKVPDGETQ